MNMGEGGGRSGATAILITHCRASLSSSTAERGKMKTPPCSLFIFFFLHYLFSYSAATLTWNSGDVPTKQQVTLESSDQTLELLFSDAVLATLHRRVPKFQIFRYDQILDFGQWSLFGFDVRQQLNRFSEKTLTFHKKFVSDTSFVYEYRFLDNLTYSHCVDVCRNYGADLPSIPLHFAEMKQFRPTLVDFFWIKTNQSVDYDKVNSRFNYKLFFDKVQIFPTNRLLRGSTILFHYLKGEFIIMASQQLRSRSSYFDFTSNSYYRLEPYLLQSRCTLHHACQVFLPLHATSFYPSFSRAKCACVRKLDENIQNAKTAKSITDSVKLQILNR